MTYPFIDCGGCTTCEIACSYRNSGKFNHNLSAIKITEKSDRTGYTVSLTEPGAAGERFSCDGCKGLSEPACIEFCHKSEELLKIIRQFTEDCQKGAE